MPRISSSARFLLLLTILLIVYGSLYPGTPRGGETSFSKAFSVLLDSWPRFWDRSLAVDLLLNILIYIPLGLLGLLSIPKRSQIARIAGPILFAFLLSLTMELWQSHLAQRVTSLLDLLANSSGAIVGVIVGLLFFDWVDESARSGGVDILRQPGAALLLTLWFSAQWLPFIPAIGIYRLRVKWTQASVVDWSHFPWDMLAAFSAWLAAMILFESLSGALAKWSFLLPIFLIPGKFFMANQQPLAGEMAGGVLALVVGWILIENRQRTTIAAAILVTAIVIGGLAPFTFGTIPARFSWVPFDITLAIKPWDAAAVILLAKAFRYGAALWLMNQCGAGFLKGGASLVFALAAIEWAQEYLPNRTAESTDPVIALLLAVILKILQPAMRPMPRKHLQRVSIPPARF